MLPQTRWSGSPVFHIGGSGFESRRQRYFGETSGSGRRALNSFGVRFEPSLPSQVFSTDLFRWSFLKRS